MPSDIADKYYALMTVIKEVHAQHADDNCWLDIDRIFHAAGLPIPDRRVGDKAAMLQNCERYIDIMCKEGGHWKSYAQIEQELQDWKDRYTSLVNLLHTVVSGASIGIPSTK